MIPAAVAFVAAAGLAFAAMASESATTSHVGHAALLLLALGFVAMALRNYRR